MDTGVKVILCIGETLEERKGGVTLDVCARQLDAVSKIVSDWSNIVVAYEPVWAIGTGLAATPEDAEETHKGIRAHLAKTIGAEQAEKPESCMVVQSTVRTLRISKTKQMLMVS